MTNDHREQKQVTITTGPIYVAPLGLWVPNDKLIITLKNPTHKKLRAQISLGLCPSPNAPVALSTSVPLSTSVDTFEVNETEINLGSFKVDPMTCLRVEKRFDNYELFDSVIRLTAFGDFEICEDSCEPICGLLEITSVVGFSGYGGGLLTALPAEMAALNQAYYYYSGLLISDPSTFVPYGDWVLCDTHCPCDSSSSSSSSDDHH
ncbi:hypothetical protein [Paenibacillus sp.]|uniref:hypothetical protein n=1 Tax=Paenibacillus sp. TaxID=58172 RepID=UPI0028ADC7D9|nr:hypothetical protein [Paenibacillus sp.]